MTRRSWCVAWRHTRLLNWGTLNFCYPRWIASFCMDAYNRTQHEPVLPAWRFKQLGYYEKWKRI